MTMTTVIIIKPLTVFVKFINFFVGMDDQGELKFNKPSSDNKGKY